MNNILKSKIQKKITPLIMKSLDAASYEQKFGDLRQRLESIVPDLTQQYSTFTLDDPYRIKKVRTLHAFQVSLVAKILDEFKDVTIVDIGDSNGTHIQYLDKLFSNGRKLNCLGVNCDAQAVERIKSKGLQALHARAEELPAKDIHADIFLLYETLEHLLNPCRFLFDLSMKTKAKYLVVTVPYLKRSRVGMRHIRKNNDDDCFAEDTHIYEFSPEDWKILFQFSGWKVKYEKIFYQYPQKHWLRFLKYYWRRCDFEGFYGVILTPDHTWSSRYRGW